MNLSLGSYPAAPFLELELTDEMILRYTTIRFSRLTKCKILPRDSDWMDSLVPSEGLRLDGFTCDYRSTRQPPTASALWSKSSYEPECLASSLEKFDLIDYTGRREEQELVEYILTTSRCLKTATISFRSLPDLNLEDKETMMQELKAIPRVSITSQLLFNS